MGLTIKEKDHWRERIGSRIRKRIEVLIASEEPGFRKRIDDMARRQVFDSTGTTSLFDRLEEIETERESAEDEHQQLLKRLDHEKEVIYRQAGQRFKVTNRGDRSYYGLETRVDYKLRELTEVKVRDLMQADPLGQKVLELESEQEALLDTVWLATSPSQIKELWSKLADLLEQTPTQLQKDALAIKPMDSESQ